MKVLWLANSPIGAKSFLNLSNLSGTWLDSLENEIKYKVDLHVAFFHPHKVQPFFFENVHYYPLSTGNYFTYLIKNIFFYQVFKKHNIISNLQLIRDIDADIIHIHGTENPFGYLPSLLNKPYVLSIQGVLRDIFVEFEKSAESYRFNYWHLTKSFPFVRSGFKMDFFKLRKMAQIEKDCLPNIENFIGRTNFDKSFVSKEVSNKYFQVNEILRDDFFNSEWNMEIESKVKFKIVSIISDSPIKGFDEILKIHAEFFKMNMFEFEFVIIGISKDANIIKNARNGKLVDVGNISFKGHLNSKEIISVMMESDLFLLPSKCENSSNSLCEAMALGMPCLAANVGGIPSLVENGYNGLLFDHNNIIDTIKKIIQLKDDAIFAKNLGDNARKSALIRHEKSQIVNKTLEVYNDIIN